MTQVMSVGPGRREDLPGLSWAEFFEAYGASFRRKHLAARPYSLPRRSALPRDFIRLDPWEGEYLYMVAQHAVRGIVEIGRFHGGSTFLLACANKRVPIRSIDVAPTDDARLRRLLAEGGVGANVELLIGDSRSDSFLLGEYDLLFVDGGHTRDATVADLERFSPDLTAGGHLVVHDCRAEFQVQQAVIDHLAGASFTAVRGPYTPASHWLTDAGSLAHLMKR